MALPLLADGAAALADAIRENRMPRLKELRWESGESGDPADREITDDSHISAYSGLVQACGDSAHVEVLALSEWFVLRPSALAGLASGASKLRTLHLECAELVAPHPRVTEGRYDDSLVPHPHPRGLNDAAARLLSSSLGTCRQLEELHVRAKWFRTHESCRLLEEGLARSTTLRRLFLTSVVDTSYKPGSVVPAVLAGLRRNWSIHAFEMSGRYHRGEPWDDPLARDLLELVRDDNLTLQTFKHRERRGIEDSVLFVLQDNRRFVRLCEVAQRRIAGLCPKADANNDDDDPPPPWRRGLLDHASERTADSLVNATALFLLLRHDPCPATLQPIRARHDSPGSATMLLPTADPIPRTHRRRRLAGEASDDPALLGDRAVRGPRRRLPDVASAPH
jgi:hypothetical protein